MKYILILCMLALCGCNTINEDRFVEEDYEKLFPPKDIEKPDNKRGNLFVQICNPNQALANYKYPGTEVPEDADEYKITITCKFQETDRLSYFVNLAFSRYEVRYINEKKELITVSCSSKPKENETPNLMYNGEEFKISFNAYSGFPLYLSVSGEGPRNSNIKAKIEAVSVDGLTEIPVLETEQFQNDEGINPLRYPFCEYIILP